MARPKAKESRVYGLTDLRTRPSTAKHKARKDEAKRKVWLVRWTVDRRDHQKAFRYQKDDRHVADPCRLVMPYVETLRANPLFRSQFHVGLLAAHVADPRTSSLAFCK